MATKHCQHNNLLNADSPMPTTMCYNLKNGFDERWSKSIRSRINLKELHLKNLSVDINLEPIKDE